MVKQLPAQTVAWDPTVWIGFSEEQLALIKKGFSYALDRAYEAERAEPGNRYADQQRELC